MTWKEQSTVITDMVVVFEEAMDDHVMGVDLAMADMAGTDTVGRTIMVKAL